MTLTEEIPGPCQVEQGICLHFLHVGIDINLQLIWLKKVIVLLAVIRLTA